MKLVVISPVLTCVCYEGMRAQDPFDYDVGDQRGTAPPSPTSGTAIAGYQSNTRGTLAEGASVPKVCILRLLALLSFDRKKDD